MKTAYLARAHVAAAVLGWGALPARHSRWGSPPPAHPKSSRRLLQDASLVISAAREGDATAQDLLAAAQADYARMVGVLYAEGYFGGVVTHPRQRA